MLTPAKLPYHLARSLVSQRSLMTIATTGALGLAVAGVAAAAPSVQTTASDTVKICVKNSDSTVRYVKSSTTKCGSGKKLITWSERGAKGATGAAGAAGAAGVAGVAGVDGTKILSGAVAPISTVGVNGDFYLNTATSTLYGPKAAGAWPSTGASLVGADGTKILSGAVAPISTVGVNGDFYLNTATSTLYGPKAAGAWPAGVSLVGATGAAGVSNWESLSSSAPVALTGTITDYPSPTCTGTKKVLGGGWLSAPLTSAAQPRIYASYPSANNIWMVKADNNGSGTPATTITVYAICATAP